jgi:DegV family protein with EDD domain
VSVTVVTDSASALPRDLAEEHGIVVVPMWVTIGGRPYREDQLSLEEVIRRAGEGLTTSGPTPGEIRERIAAATREGEALVLTVARRLSGVFEAARLAAEPFGERVRVLDTGTAAGAEGLVVLAAARAAAAGEPLERVEAAARRAAARVRLLATLASLDWIVRGGHVPGLAAWAGRSLGLKPLIELRAGRVRPLRPARSDRAVIERTVAACLEGRTPGARLHVAAMHALAPEPAERLLAAIRERVEPATAFVGPFGPVMIAHTGPELYGLAWWWEEAQSSAEGAEAESAQSTASAMAGTAAGSKA